MVLARFYSEPTHGAKRFKLCHQTSLVAAAPLHDPVGRQNYAASESNLCCITGASRIRITHHTSRITHHASRITQEVKVVLRALT